MYYQEVQKLFGTPLAQVPKPHIPFKLKRWHWIAGIVVTGLTLYGGYCLYTDISEKFAPIAGNKKGKS